MISFLAGQISRLTGPMLVYILLGLVATNALTGAMLKSAWQENATVMLVAENQALRDANDKNILVTAELEKLRKERDDENAQRKKQTHEADENNAAILLALEVEHEKQLLDLEVVTNEISDDDFFCASEPIAPVQLVGMRDTIAAYNRNRNNPQHEIDPP